MNAETALDRNADAMMAGLTVAGWLVFAIGLSNGVLGLGQWLGLCMGVFGSAALLYHEVLGA